MIRNETEIITDPSRIVTVVIIVIISTISQQCYIIIIVIIMSLFHGHTIGNIHTRMDARAHNNDRRLVQHELRNQNTNEERHHAQNGQQQHAVCQAALFRVVSDRNRY